MITIKETKGIVADDVIEIYRANHWSSANRPEELINALLNSYVLITAWDNDRLIGLGNALSDGHLAVYYPHLIIHPDDDHNKGTGSLIMQKLKEKFKNFHQQILVADAKAVGFYKNCGFGKAGGTPAM